MNAWKLLQVKAQNEILPPDLSHSEPKLWLDSAFYYAAGTSYSPSFEKGMFNCC